MGIAVLVLISAAVLAVAIAGTANQRSGGLTARVVLDRVEVRGGGVVRGEVVFDNRTSKSRVIVHSCETDGLYAIGFRAENGYLDHPAFSLVGCDEDLPGNELIAKPGITVFQFRVAASYVTCTGGAELAAKDSPDWSPRCLEGPGGKRDVMPPLPPGTYSTLFVPNGTSTGPHVTAAQLVVTAQS